MMRTLAPFVACLAGCGFALPVPSPDYKPTEEPVCTSSRSAPIGDLIMSGTSLFFLSAAAACASNTTDGEVDPDALLKECSGVNTIMLTTGVIAVLAAVSAARGFSKTSTCRKQWRLHRDCLQNGTDHCTVPDEPEPAAPPPPTDQPSPECQAHRQAIRATTDPKARTRLIRKTPSRCLH